MTTTTILTHKAQNKGKLLKEEYALDKGCCDVLVKSLAGFIKKIYFGQVEFGQNLGNSEG